MKKILFLAAGFPPYLTIGSARAGRFAAALPGYGWEPIVVAPPPFGTGDGFSCAEARVVRTGQGLGDTVLDDPQKALCAHGWKIPPKGRVRGLFPGIFSDEHPLSGWEKGAGALASEIVGERSAIAAIYAQGTAAAPLKLAMELSLRHGIPVLFDLVGPIDPPSADMPPGAMGSEDTARLEGKVLTSGHALITPTRMLKEHFLRKYFGRLTHDDITIIPTPSGVPVQTVPPGRGAVIFLGRLEGKGLGRFLEALARAASSGGGPFLRGLTIACADASGLERLLGRKGLAGKVRVVGSITEAEELGLLGDAAIVGFVEGASLSAQLLVPDRAVDAVAMGRMVFAAAPEGALVQFCREAGGYAADSADIGEMAAMFGRIAADDASGSIAACDGRYGMKYATDAVLAELVRVFGFMLPV